VKALALTPDGVERRSQVLALLARPPESVTALDPGVLASISAGLERILVAEPSAGSGSGGSVAGPSRPDDAPEDPSSRNQTR
jgi:hypothetical protein